MKVFLSSVGLEESIKYTISDIEENINNARGKISSCPSNFKYASFVNSLSSDLSKINRRLDKLLSVSSRIDKEYEDDVVRSKEKYNNIEDTNFVEREGFKNLNVELSSSGIHTTVEKKTMDSSDVVSVVDNKDIINPNETRGKYQSTEDFSTDKTYTDVEGVDANETRGKYQTSENFATTKEYNNVEGVDSNETRGKYQSTEDYNTNKTYTNIEGVDANETRGKYQSTEDFSTSKQYTNIEGVDPNETRGKYQS